LGEIVRFAFASSSSKAAEVKESFGGFNPFAITGRGIRQSQNRSCGSLFIFLSTPFESKVLKGFYGETMIEQAKLIPIPGNCPLPEQVLYAICLSPKKRNTCNHM